MKYCSKYKYAHHAVLASFIVTKQRLDGEKCADESENTATVFPNYT
jgi:hypothetical protein